MCIVALALNVNPEFPIVLIGNRDEFYNRPALPAIEWEGQGIIAGVDKTAGGTWFGVSSENSRWAIITNHRDLSNINPEAPTRGDLIPNFLKSVNTVKEYIDSLKPVLKSFNGFNLILGEGKDAWFISNHENRIEKLDSGFYGLSNATLNTPWPKVEVLSKGFKEIILGDESFKNEQFFKILSNNSAAADEELPSTGVGLEWERKLSSIFIKSENYGTRCSSVFAIDKNGNATIEERTFPINGDAPFDASFQISGFIK